MVVHFPVALIPTAVVCDVALLARFRLAWLDRAAALLYALAAVSSGAAAASGKLAERSLGGALDEGLAHVVGVHGDWAFFTVVLSVLVAFLRFDVLWQDRAESAPRMNRRRYGAMVLALLCLGAVVTTAARGGALVYRHGVGRGIIEGRR